MADRRHSDRAGLAPTVSPKGQAVGGLWELSPDRRKVVPDGFPDDPGDLDPQEPEHALPTRSTLTS